MTFKRSVLTATLMMVAMPALAHTGTHTSSGFAAGFMHPLGGLDHALAMLTVGLFAALLGGRALWIVPASFVVMMLVGGALGMAGIAIPAVETGIAASVVILGLAVALGRSLPIGAAMALVGVFAIFHGYAHGAEMPTGVGTVFYSLGFALASAMLHGTGIAASLTALGNSRLARLTGTAIAAAGLVVAFG